MMAEKDSDATAAARIVARTISDFRKEFWARIGNDIEKEVEEMEASGFDPARGRGRGPFWADTDGVKK